MFQVTVRANPLKQAVVFGTLPGTFSFSDRESRDGFVSALSAIWLWSYPEDGDWHEGTFDICLPPPENDELELDDDELPGMRDRW